MPIFILPRESRSLVIRLIGVLTGIGLCCGALLNVSNTFIQGLCQTVLYGSFLHTLLLGTVVSAAKERNLKLPIITAGIGVRYSHNLSRLIFIRCNAGNHMYRGHHGRDNGQNVGRGFRVTTWRKHRVVLRFGAKLCVWVLVLDLLRDHRALLQDGLRVRARESSSLSAGYSTKAGGHKLGRINREGEYLRYSNPPDFPAHLRQALLPRHNCWLGLVSGVHGHLHS